MLILTIVIVNIGTLTFVLVDTGLDPYVLWDPFIRFQRSILLAIVTCMNIHTLVAYMQVCVFKHIKEINDEICSKFLRRVIFLSNAWVAPILPVNDQLHSENPSESPDCWESLLHPIHTRF